jgi:hypothetical protein
MVTLVVSQGDITSKNNIDKKYLFDGTVRNDITETYVELVKNAKICTYICMYILHYIGTYSYSSIGKSKNIIYNSSPIIFLFSSNYYLFPRHEKLTISM